MPTFICTPSRAAAIVASCLSLSAAGCSIGNTGTLAAHVTPAIGAVVVELYYVGGVVRTADFDTGGTLGFSRRSYVYPASLPDLPAPGWHWLHVTLPDEQPVAWSTKSYGLEGSVTVAGGSASLGYEAVTVMAAVPADADVAYRLAYSQDDPAATELSACEGIKGC
jgi:hypothetical protein